MRFTKSRHIVTAPTSKRGSFGTAQLHTSLASPTCHLHVCSLAPAPLSSQRQCVTDISPPFSREDTKAERLSHPARLLQTPAQGGWHWGVSGKPGDCCPSGEEGAWGRLVPQEGCSVSLRAFGRQGMPATAGTTRTPWLAPGAKAPS